MAKSITINRAPVLTLWAAVVAERLGFDWDEALTLGRAVAGLTAYSKGKRLGLTGTDQTMLQRATESLSLAQSQELSVRFRRRDVVFVSTRGRGAYEL